MTEFLKDSRRLVTELRSARPRDWGWIAGRMIRGGHRALSRPVLEADRRTTGQIEDVNHLLHDLRSGQLRELPPISGPMLSAGCAGSWYFEWIEKCTGFVGEHIGIEYYAPKPPDLPTNVEWISNTVSDMSRVANTSCEMVLSGQNLEHLWPDEVVGFFLESARVLKSDGWLVFDSPNRLMTELLGWSHPEHTVELTPKEARALAELAGFDVVRLVGLWLCREPTTGRMMKFDPFGSEDQWSLIERVLAAESNPEDSFLYWLVARKARDPQPDALAAQMHSIFRTAWPERQRRFVSGVGAIIEEGGQRRVRTSPNESGALAFGPYMPLKAGRYRVEWMIRLFDVPSIDRPVVRCDVVGNEGREIAVTHISARDLSRTDNVVRVDIFLDSLEFGIQARCFSKGGATVECDIPITFTPLE